MATAITRLRIVGFKSFAEPVLISILPGLTGIVGPNGCGKSNVVDALRWAMGETSARSLRGGDMDEVIFAGSAGRPSRELASVTVGLDDAVGLAPPPFEREPELEITREIERGVGSSYRINGRAVRARDVQTLFADMASGARSSAMVSQGRVAFLVDARPEERRSVLDEAAGITGLGARRHEAELRLRATENNLSRAADLRAGLDERLASLSRDAAEALRHRELTGSLAEAERRLAALSLGRTRRAQAETAGRAVAASDEAAAAAETLRNDEEAERLAEEALGRCRAEAALGRAGFERARAGAGAAESAERFSREALDAGARRLAELGRDLGHAEEAAKDALAVADALGDEIVRLDEIQRTAPAELAERRDEVGRLLAAREKAERTLRRHADAAALRRQADELGREVAAEGDLLARLERDGAASRPDEAAAELIASRRRELLAVAETAGRALAAREAERREAADRLAASRLGHADRDAALRRARDGLAENDRRVRDATERGEALDRRLASLREAHDDKALRRAEDAARSAEAAEAAAADALDAAVLALGPARAEAEAARRLLRDGREASLAAAALRERRLAERAALAERLDRLLQGLAEARTAAPPRAVLDGAVGTAERSRRRHDEAAAGIAPLRENLATAEKTVAARRVALGAEQAVRAAFAAECDTLRRLAGPDEDGVLALTTCPERLGPALAASLGDALLAGLDEEERRSWRDLGPLEDTALPDGVSPLWRVVDAPAALRRALDRVGLVDGPDAFARACRLAPTLGPGTALVTPDGGLVRWDGFTIRDGTPSAVAERLRTRQLLLDRERALAAAAERCGELGAALSAAEAEAAELRQEDSRAADALRAAAAAHEGDRVEAARLRDASDDAERRAALIGPEADRIAADLEQLEAALAAAESDDAALGERLALSERRERDAERNATEAIGREERERAARRDRELGRSTAAAERDRLRARKAETAALLGALAPERDAAAALVAERVRERDAVAVLVPEHETAWREVAARLDRDERHLAEATKLEAEGRNALASARDALADAELRLERLDEAFRLDRDRRSALGVRRAVLDREAARALAARDAADAAERTLPTLPGGTDAAAAHEGARRAEDLAVRALAVREAALDEALRRHVTAERERAAAVSRRDEAASRAAELRRRAAGAVEEERAREGRHAALAVQLEAARRSAAEAEARHDASAAAEALAAASLDERRTRRRDASARRAATADASARAAAAAEEAVRTLEATEARLAETGLEVEAAADATERDEAEARRLVGRLGRERDALGPVNGRAEAELGTVQARAEALGREHDELEAAVARLRQSIRHLDREGRERLTASFLAIDAEFRALFARMFEGGRAHLALVGSDDPLEAGLEIFAQPPGKKLTTLSLLSGGEQALTALSLIFAAFRCNPAPISVLDEVDAPLDDANVGRFCRLVADMAKEGDTRFLVVTHHQLTMAHMDRLYGVTMQERGVSRIVSVDLGRAREIGARAS